jgi:hypothetical protein
MDIVTIKLVLNYIKTYKFRLVFFTLSGFFVGVIYNLSAPKIYEAYIDIAMPQVNHISNGSFTPGSILITPSVDEIRKSYQNPINISESLLRACTFSGLTNENRKALASQIFSQSADPQNSRIAVRVKVVGRDAVLACAKALEQEIISKSNLQKNAYLNNNPHNAGILNINAASRGAVVVSDSYISPRPVLYTLGATILGFLFSIFATWFIGQWKKNTR